MNTSTWRFGDLNFPRPDLRSFTALYKDAIDRIGLATHGDDIMEIMFEVDGLSCKFTDLLSANFIKHTMDTNDPRYEEDQRWYDENQPLFTKAILEFNDAIYNSPYKDYIEDKIGSMYFANMDVKKKTFCEENLPLQQRENELVNEYQRLIASCRAEIQGEPKTFMELQSLLAHEDREVRKAAFKGFSDFLSSNEEELEKIWDELLIIRNQMGRNLGYENYIPVAYLDRLRLTYGEKEVESFRQQVAEEIVPLCNQIFQFQARNLGLDEIKVYDEKVIFKDGNAKPVGDREYMFNQTVKMLRDMSPETDEFISFMLDHELIDYESRPEKAAREYVTMLPSKKAPFIFAHFDGTPNSVQFLHEGLGYGFAAYRASRRQPFEEYYSSCAEIMEIHSMSMIHMASRYADWFFGEDGWKYVFSNLQNLLTFIPFGTAVDEFQHICYKNTDLTPKERTAIWRDLEKKYMPWRKYDEEDEFMEQGGYWYHKAHFFTYPFYYIEYALATINAMEMYQKFVERPGTAWKEYLELTDVGGSRTYLETLELANLTPAFQDGAVARSIEYVKTVLNDYMK